MYDWANSVYSLVITSSLFPVFFGLVALNKADGNTVDFLGFKVLNSALFSFSVSFSFLLAGLTSPLLTALADLGNNRKSFLRFFCILGSLSCIALATFSGQHLEWGMAFFVLASLGYSASIVFYNSYLPSIAGPDQLNAVSARGFAMGYIGSVILLIFILLPILLPSVFGFLGLRFVQICRIGFVLTGLWWLFFGLFAIRSLPDASHLPTLKRTWKNIRIRLISAWLMTFQLYGLGQFLLAFFLINTGVQTIMYLAALFGDKELHLPAEKLILTILILQLVAIIGARFFAWLAGFQGAIPVLILVSAGWIGASIGAYFIQNEMQFYLLAALVGSVMGGTQSMMRSVFAGFLPEEETSRSALFGWFDLLDKISTVLGTFLFGFINQMTGSMRWSALSLTVFFIMGMIILWFIWNRRPSLIKA